MTTQEAIQLAKSTLETIDLDDFKVGHNEWIQLNQDLDLNITRYHDDPIIMLYGVVSDEAGKESLLSMEIKPDG